MWRASRWRSSVVLACAIVVSGASFAAGQATITGRVGHPKFAGSQETIPLPTILCFASPTGGDSEPLSFRTWETQPAGWFRMTGSAGNYSLLFTGPGHFLRPIVRTNVFLREGETVDGPVTPRFDFASFDSGAWDDKRASDYYQTFVARGTSLTHVGFKLAHDGIDGGGPGAQNVLVSLRRRGAGTPDTWEQVGPTAVVVDVDAGGVKDYLSSAGWNSGEAPLVPGETYAIHLRPERAGQGFQAYWRPDADARADCYRRGATGEQGFRGRDLWLAVGADGDGLVIPYNKRVHKQFGELTNCVRRWSQTYVAQGRGLASVVVYAAVSGAQPPLSRQRIVVRIRRDGTDGPVVGREKIAVGNGNYTGDASWGVFGCALAPGEVPLEPGRTYAIEMESIETYETLHGFVNIKGEVSNDRPGFNPYRKHPRDDYPAGTAFRDGMKMDYDLDLQIVEYAQTADEWSRAVESRNLLLNGDMETGELNAADPLAGKPAAWKPFALDPGTALAYLTEAPEGKNRRLRVLGGSFRKQTADGGFVQSVAGLSRLDTYRVSGQVRSSWPDDDQHQCYVGIDPTGQTDDAAAKSIVWTKVARLHGVWATWTSEPIRPAKEAISVWLRGRTTTIQPLAAFKADFDDFHLRRVRDGAPDGR